MALMFRLLLGWTMLKRSVCTRRELKQQVRSNFLSLESTKPDSKWLCISKGPTRKMYLKMELKFVLVTQLSVPWGLCGCSTFPMSLSSNSTLSREFSSENCPRALLCTFWHSAFWEFNTIRLVGCPVLSTCLGSQTSEIPDISGSAFQTEPTSQVSSCLWGCPKGTEVWAAELPAQPWWEGNADRVSLFCVNISFAICERNLHSHLEWKNSFLSQDFSVKHQFLRSVVLYDCNLFTSFLHAEHQWEFWELSAKIARSKIFTMMLYENVFGMADNNKSLPWLLRQKSQHINSQCRCF